MTDVEKRSAGAPAKYGPHMVTKAAELAADGLIDAEIAIELGIHVRTLHAWKRVHPKFAEALRSAKDSVDDRVEESLINPRSAANTPKRSQPPVGKSSRCASSDTVTCRLKNGGWRIDGRKNTA